MNLEDKISKQLADSINKSIVESLLDKKTETEIKLIPQTGYSKTETTNGVVIQLGEKFWGIIYQDGKSKHYGWVDLDRAEIYNKEYLKLPEHATYENSPDIKELKKATLVEITLTKIKHFNLNY